MTPVWNDYMEDRKQLEIDFTSPDQKVASELGIRWTPDEATPEQIKEWHETEGKWWGDRAMKFVFIASIVQVSALAFMLLSFKLIQLYIEKPL